MQPARIEHLQSVDTVQREVSGSAGDGNPGGDQVVEALMME